MNAKVHLVLSTITLPVVFACLLVFTPHTDAWAQNANTQVSPVAPLRSAHTIFIRSKSVYFKPSTLENSLLQQEEFSGWGMSITRNEADADLIIEVGRKAFTTSFIYSVLDTKTQRVVASGRVNSIGGTVEGKITSSLMKKLRAVQQT
jgi:hypothetical protein